MREFHEDGRIFGKAGQRWPVYDIPQNRSLLSFVKQRCSSNVDECSTIRFANTVRWAIGHQYVANNRIAGNSKYNLFKMFSLAINARFAFTTSLIRWMSCMGDAITLLGFSYLIYCMAIWFSSQSVQG